MEDEVLNRLRNLLGENFSTTCQVCYSMKKRWYCIDCSSAHCSVCFFYHRSHRGLVEIRTFKKQDAVEFNALASMTNCDSIQPYKRYDGVMMLLHKRVDEGRPAGHNLSRAYGSGYNTCRSCQCPLPAPHVHCSLSCMVGDFERRKALESSRATSGSAAAASSSATSEVSTDLTLRVGSP